jgi:hypothetical protein
LVLEEIVEAWTQTKGNHSKATLFIRKRNVLIKGEKICQIQVGHKEELRDDLFKDVNGNLKLRFCSPILSFIGVLLLGYVVLSGFVSC